MPASLGGTGPAQCETGNDRPTSEKVLAAFEALDQLSGASE